MAKAKQQKHGKLQKVLEQVDDTKVEGYEFMAALKPLLPEDVREKTVNVIKKLISDADGKFLEEDIWGKKHMAYDIKGHDEAYYIVYRVELPTSALPELHKQLNLIGDLLRFIFVKESEL